MANIDRTEFLQSVVAKSTCERCGRQRPGELMHTSGGDFKRVCIATKSCKRFAKEKLNGSNHR